VLAAIEAESKGRCVWRLLDAIVVPTAPVATLLPDVMPPVAALARAPGPAPL
jgi:hypothetical protein